MDSALALSKLRPMTDYVSRATAPVSFTTIIAAVFGGLGLLLATIGVYGLISYSISQRTHEVGVRMALGARQSQIVALILREGLVLVIAGISLGLVCAAILLRYAQSLLFGVSAYDPITYITVGSVLVATSLVACWRPAFKASRGSVLDALRT